MSIRWRLAILAIQLAILGSAAWWIGGTPLLPDAWFVSGLLAIVINPQLLDPFYVRPQDVIANSVFGLALILLANKDTVPALWTILAVLLVVSALLALLAVLLGAGREVGETVRFARAARLLSQYTTSWVVYSSIFWLSVIEEFRITSDAFAVAVAAWVALVIIGHVNWQSVWSAATGRPIPGQVEGMLGPSRIAITAPDIPPVASDVVLESGNGTVRGVVVRRFRRSSDVWGDIYLEDTAAAERLVSSGRVDVRPAADQRDRVVVGSVEAGSTVERLVFTANSNLELGSCVAVPLEDGKNLMFQLYQAEVMEEHVRGGGHLTVRAMANPIGIFSDETATLKQFRWVPPPGGPVIAPAPSGLVVRDPPKGQFLVGKVIGADIPIYLDLEEVVQGHLAILGMTKMGKTTLCLRLANALAENRRIVFLDQTGEYVAKRNVLQLDPADPWCIGIRVHEPEDNEVLPEFALAFLERTMGMGAAEYRLGNPIPRTLVLDETHQFVPEPASMSFNAPGRESAVNFGLSVLRVRKYGISIVLISQRTAVVAKSALSQCENLIAFRSVDQTGLDYLEAIGGPQVRGILPRLRQGEALLTGPAFSAESPVVVRVEPG